jgi:hypothetical protein
MDLYLSVFMKLRLIAALSEIISRHVGGKDGEVRGERGRDFHRGAGPVRQAVSRLHQRGNRVTAIQLMNIRGATSHPRHQFLSEAPLVIRSATSYLMRL